MDALITRIRGGGKTYQLVKWYKEASGNRVIIVHDERARRNLIEQYDIPAKDVVNVHNAQMTLRGRNAQVGVDNADIILAMFLDQHVDLVTFTGDVRNPDWSTS